MPKKKLMQKFTTFTRKKKLTFHYKNDVKKITLMHNSLVQNRKYKIKLNIIITTN
jgi:hypothetical protein